MRAAHILFMLAAGLRLAVAPANASPISLDFEADGLGTPLPAGSIVDAEYANLGISISAVNFWNNNVTAPIIFDTANPTGNDYDLRTPGSGPNNTVPLDNVLIIPTLWRDDNNDGLIDDPNDEGRRPSGIISFDLGLVYDGAQFVFIDTEEHGGTVEFFFNGNPVGSAAIPSTLNNGVTSAVFAGADFDAFDIRLAGSGAVAAVTLVPEPAALTLAGVSALALLRRRRRCGR